MKNYTNRPWIRRIAACALTTAGVILWLASQPPMSNQQEHAGKNSRHSAGVPDRPATKPNNNPVSKTTTKESLATMSMEERLEALAAYYERHGFAATVSLLAAFHGDQETYQATKLLAVLASQKEPKAVFTYLADHDAYLLSDPDVMLTLMGAGSELFPMEFASKYASMMPAGGARLQAYNYLSQIMAEPANAQKITGIVANIKDRGTLSYLERSLPRSLLQANKIGEAIRLIEELDRYGEFTNRNDFVDAGALMAQKSGHTMAGLFELEALESNKASAFFQGYIEEMLKDGKHTYNLLEYTLKRYKDQHDDGALLALVFKRALAADPDITMDKLQQAGIAPADLNALVTRNLVNFTENHPSKALAYINNQTDTLVRDNMLSRYGLTLRNTNTRNIRDIESMIGDPYVKASYVLEATYKISAEQPQAVYDLIMDYKSSKIKTDLITVNLVPIAIHDIDLGITLVKEIADKKLQSSSLTALIDVAAENKEKMAKVFGARSDLEQNNYRAQPTNNSGENK